MGRHLVPAVLAVVWLLPLLAMVTGSLRRRGAPPPTGVELLPADPTLGAYATVFEVVPLAIQLRNSLLVAAIAVPLTVLVAASAGYGIRLLAPRRQRLAIAAVLVAMLVPVTGVWATRFELFRLLGVIDTWVPLVATALVAANPFLVLVYVWGFTRVQDEQLEAARLDGASSWTAFWRVALPQTRAVTIAVTVLAFAFHWGNLMDPLLYLNSPGRFTAPLGVDLLRQLNPTDAPLLLAGAVIVSLPVLVVFLLGQRRLFDVAVGDI